MGKRPVLFFGFLLNRSAIRSGPQKVHHVTSRCINQQILIRPAWCRTATANATGGGPVFFTFRNGLKKNTPQKISPLCGEKSPQKKTNFGARHNEGAKKKGDEIAK